MIWLLALGLLLRTISLNQSFWLDETAQAVLSRAPLFSVNYSVDFQPPLYYILSHFWMGFGNLLGLGHAEWFLRLLSVFFGVATIYVVYVLGEKLFSRNTGLLAAGFVTIAPFHIYYSQEFRMYSLLTLLCALCWYELANKRWITLSLLVTLSLFTHYFAFVNLIAMGTYLLYFREKRGFGYLVSGLIPFSLWIPTLLKQLTVANQLVSLWPKWSEVSSTGFIKFLPLLAAKWTVGMIRPESKMIYAVSVAIFALIAGCAGFFFLWAMLTEKISKRHNYHVLVHYGIASILIAWLGGLWFPAATPTRIQFVLPAIYLIIAEGCMRVLVHEKYKKIIFACISTFCAIQLFFSLQYLFNPKYHREDWRGAIAYTDDYISSHESDNVIALTIFNDKWAPMDWYSRYPNQYMGGSSYFKSQNEFKHKQIILYTYLFEIFDNTRSTEHNLLKDYNLEEEKDFRGVGIIKTYSKK